MIKPYTIIKVSIRWENKDRKIGGVHTQLFERFNDVQPYIEDFIRKHDDDGYEVEAPEIIQLSGTEKMNWEELEYVVPNDAYIRTKPAPVLTLPEPIQVPANRAYCRLCESWWPDGNCQCR